MSKVPKVSQLLTVTIFFVMSLAIVAPVFAVSPTPADSLRTDNLMEEKELELAEVKVLSKALPEVYFLPDSPFYLLVKLWESAHLLWADTPQERSELLFQFAEKRLAETMELIQKDKILQAQVSLDRYRGQFSRAVSGIQESGPQADQEKRYSLLEEQMWYQRALGRIMQAEGLSDLFIDLETQLDGTITASNGRLELREVGETYND